MVTALTILSSLGIAQALILAAIYFKGYGKHNKNIGLGWLFLLFAAAMMVILLSNTVTSAFHDILEVSEYVLTFTAGPILYLVANSLRQETDDSWGRLMLHFSPAILYLGIAAGTGLTESSLVIPILIPILHMQAYTAWLLITLWQNQSSSANRFTKSGWGWLKLLSIMLVFLHTAQWVRIIFTGADYLEFIIPVTGFTAIYGLIIYGFVNPSLYTESGRSAYRFNAENCRKRLNILEQKMKENKIYQSHDLTLNKLALMVNIPSHEISYIINNGLNKNFNEWINEYRINLFKGMVNDTSNQHLTIDALAEEAGFNSRSSFYHAFKKLTGTTPTKYRKNG